MKLSDTQLIVLSAAAQREDRGIALPPKLRGGAAQKFAAKLLRDGLVEEVRARGVLPVWRRDDANGPMALRMSRSGRGRAEALQRGNGAGKMKGRAMKTHSAKAK